MFKQTKSSDTLAQSMQLELRGSSISGITHGVECLNKAANIFDNIGMRKEAAVVRAYLQEIIG